MSQLFSGFVGALVGFSASVAVVLAAAQAVGATDAQTISWITGLALAKAAASVFLSWRYRQPIISAWSTPGAALIAATSGLNLSVAVGAFLVAAALMILTALVKPLGALVARIPMSIASAMLGGVIFRFVVAVFDEMRTAPALVALALAVFLVVRLINPFGAVIASLVVGIVAALASGLATWPALTFAPTLIWTPPVFDAATIIGLGVPLYLVTMAAQNLPGFAVMRASGYEPPVQPALFVTGLTSLLTAPFGAHMVNMAAISAAICTGPDTHPDPKERWKAGVWYALCWFGIALGAAPVVTFILAMPKALIVAAAGLGLVGSLAGALGTAMTADKDRFAAVIAFCVAASSLSLFGIGSAFWSLVAGLAVLGLDRAAPVVNRWRR
ncbi:MAG: benzoate transporter [Rhizobiales bacterium 65-9]|nr:benzoate/H(+) symporter BenE family transporter [Hyphomicrobiales bacterium]OJY32895.1 MAG: benzoate transporter [Rhizobiales bacterium 65-9]